jgi:hypothetical protein
MKNLNDYSETILKAWAYHEALRRLGFLSKDIYVDIYREPVASVLVFTFGTVLRAQGKKFVVSCGAYPDAATAMGAMTEWDEFVDQLPSFSDEELQEVFAASEVWGASAEFVLSLRKKGFMFPYDKN